MDIVAVSRLLREAIRNTEDGPVRDLLCAAYEDVRQARIVLGL